MKFYEGRAFTSEEKILGCEVIGNPAVVAICEEGVFPGQEEMVKIAVERGAPMLAFVKQQENNTHHFDIRYFAPGGAEFTICGHATLVAARSVFNYYQLRDDELIW